MIIYEEILRDFQKQKVKYVLVGGIAFNLLGGNRNTLDADILVEMSNENLAKIVKILKRAGYHVKQPVDPIMIADKKTRNDWIKNKHMKAFNFYKSERSYEEVDIIIESPVSFEEAKIDALKVRVGTLTLPVISKKNFIKMKKSAGRDKDILDIKEIMMLSK
ncbi:MAG: nucleotidyltransferase family protein [Candidatus Omnitrophica bacterium]|nr:nucleotidyltransferase family protein [Candidatus Omnitrophota bacterium]MBU1870445.1 nucleotidyltransferase family protein [Candidatus Omnitrophota bacterium]